MLRLNAVRLGLALYVSTLTLGRSDIGGVSLNTVSLRLTPQQRVLWEPSFRKAFRIDTKPEENDLFFSENNISEETNSHEKKGVLKNEKAWLRIG